MSVSSGVPSTKRTCSLLIPGLSWDTISWRMKFSCWISTLYGVTPGMRGTLVQPDAARQAAAAAAKAVLLSISNIITVDGLSAKPEGQRPQGDAAPAQDPRAVRGQQGAPPLRRGRLQGAAGRGHRCRPRHGLPGPHAVRAGRAAFAAAFRDR